MAARNEYTHIIRYIRESLFDFTLLWVRIRLISDHIYYKSAENNDPRSPETIPISRMRSSAILKDFTRFHSLKMCRELKELSDIRIRTMGIGMTHQYQLRINPRARARAAGAQERSRPRRAFLPHFRQSRRIRGRIATLVGELAIAPAACCCMRAVGAVGSTDPVIRWRVCPAGRVHTGEKRSYATSHACCARQVNKKRGGQVIRGKGARSQPPPRGHAERSMRFR